MSNVATAEKPKPAKLPDAKTPVVATPAAKAATPETPKFKIEKGIPIPERTRFGTESKYPWKDLAEKGDSFFIPGATVKSFGGSVTSAGKRLGVRLTARTVEGGVRVWRAE